MSNNKKELIDTEHYSLLTSEIEPGLGIEVFRVWNTYHSLPKEKKVEMLETIMDWSSDELEKIKLSIHSTSNTDLTIGVYLNNKQHTAVEWLEKICNDRGYYLMSEYFEQAKEMEIAGKEMEIRLVLFLYFPYLYAILVTILFIT